MLLYLTDGNTKKRSKVMFDASFINILSTMRNKIPANPNRRIRYPWLVAAFGKEKALHPSTNELRAISMLHDLFELAGLELQPFSRPAAYQTESLNGISYMIAGAANAYTPDNSQFTDWECVYEQLSMYVENLHKEDYSLAAS